MSMFSHKKENGFTLIELLVVIAIIGILASVVLASLADARSVARDAKRKSDLHQSQIAMELYFNKFGTYIVANAGWMDGGNGWFAHDTGGYNTSVSQALYNRGFLADPVFDDPIQSPGYMIYVRQDGKAYSISATLENPTPENIEHAYNSFNGGFDNPTCNNVPGSQAGGYVGCNAIVARYGKNYAVPN